MVDDEPREEETINLADEEEFVDEENMTPEQTQRLKEKLNNIYADEATQFMDEKEERDLENAIVTRATAADLKEGTQRTYEIKLVINTIPTGKFEEKEDQYTGEKTREEIMQKIVKSFEVRLPKDADKMGLQSLGINSIQDMRNANLTPKQEEKLNIEVSKFLSRCVLDPKMTPKQWREDVTQNIFNNLLWRLMSATVVTDEASLIDFFTAV